MRILLTNDDGIQSPGLLRLAEWAQKLGDVTVCAPMQEQSAKSHSINIRTAFRVQKVDVLPGAECYSADSTPADCVRFATFGLGRSYDLILSGINRGYNLGYDILYSGTDAAVFEAGLLGIPAIALSTIPEDFSPALAALDEVLDFFRRNELLSRHPIYNVNIPPQHKGIVITRQGGPFFRDHFVCMGPELYQQKGDYVYTNRNDLTLDTDAAMNGYISIMPFTTQRVDLEAYEKLKDLK